MTLQVTFGVVARHGSDPMDGDLVSMSKLMWKKKEGKRNSSELDTVRSTDVGRIRQEH